MFTYWDISCDDILVTRFMESSSFHRGINKLKVGQPWMQLNPYITYNFYIDSDKFGYTSFFQVLTRRRIN